MNGFIFMRNPNGYGSVYKLSGKRRRPFVASITTGQDELTGKTKTANFRLLCHTQRSNASLGRLQHQRHSN